MDFKKLNPRAVILLSVAAVMVLGTIIIRMLSHGPMPEENPSIPAITSHQEQIKEITDEDSQSMKEMKEQMDSDRLQQKKIKMLKLQLEQTNLQLEQEKALSEIGKLEKDNTSIVNDSNDQDEDKYPDVKVIYIGGTVQDRQAILSINGNNYSVKEKNKPVKNVEVLSITDTAVTLHFNLPQELNTTIEYKPE